MAGHAEHIVRIRTTATGGRVAIMADLPRPTMRLGTIEPEPIQSVPGESFTLTTGDVIGNLRRVSMSTWAAALTGFLESVNIATRCPPLWRQASNGRQGARPITTGGRMAGVRRQAAVVPYRIRGERVEVALVTTSRGRGWIIPKGSVDKGEQPRDAAIREAKEEAGLLGILALKPVGRYLHENGNGPCRVDVYLMRVTAVLARWPEYKLRRRRWMRITDAAACMREELRRPFIRAIEGVVKRES